MKKAIKYIVLIISVIVCLSLPITAMAYDTETVGTVTISDVYSNYMGIITKVPVSSNNQNYMLWMQPDYTTLNLTFQANFTDTVSNFKLEIPIDYSYLTSYQITSCQLHAGGDLETASSYIENDKLVIAGLNSSNTNYVICEILFDVKGQGAEPGYIYFGRFAQASYDVVYDMSGTIDELESTDAQLDEHMDYSQVDPPTVSTPSDEEMDDLSGFMGKVWDALYGWQTPILLSVTLGALGFILALKGGAG